MEITGNFNKRPNAHEIRLNNVILYFSYNTIVGFEDLRPGLPERTIVRENVWGAITGKHLTAIDSGSTEAKARRVTGEEFEALLDGVLAEVAF